jgi:hypothetical protein
MSRLRVISIGLLLLVVTAGIVWRLLPKDESTILSATNDPSRKIVLYSLDPSKGESNDDTQGVLFHGWPVLGKIELDADQQRGVMDSVQAAIQTPGVVSKKCFDPRHGLQVTSEGHTIDYVICFACSNIEIYKDDKRFKYSTISPEPSVLLNQILTQNAVPLSPK